MRVIINLVRAILASVPNAIIFSYIQPYVRAGHEPVPDNQLYYYVLGFYLIIALLTYMFKEMSVLIHLVLLPGIICADLVLFIVSKIVPGLFGFEYPPYHLSIIV